MACIWKENEDKNEAKNEDSKEATKIDPFAIVWTVKGKDKLIPVVVGHITREISRFTKFCLNYCGKIEVKFFLHTKNHPQSHQEDVKYPLLLSFRYLRKNQRY